MNWRRGLVLAAIHLSICEPLILWEESRNWDSRQMVLGAWRVDNDLHADWRSGGACNGCVAVLVRTARLEGVPKHSRDFARQTSIQSWPFLSRK
jgi:hypothetical protein